MSSNRNSSSSGIGICGVLTIVFNEFQYAQLVKVDNTKKLLRK